MRYSSGAPRRMMTSPTFSLNIVTERTSTIRDLSPGDLYITVTAFRRERLGSNTIHNIRRRTEDPFKSETFYGAQVRSYPSDKVYIVEDRTSV